MEGSRQAGAIYGVVAALVCTGCATESAPTPAPTPRVLTPDHALAQVERWFAARATNDVHALSELAATDILAPGDPATGATLVGREAVVKALTTEGTTTKSGPCVLELAIVSATEAFALHHCTATFLSKSPPLARPAAGRRITRLRFDRTGLISEVTSWKDELRMMRQVGVAIDADARPDIPSGRVEIVRAGSDSGEAANERTARAIVAGFDRRDAAAVASHVGDGYVQHRLAAAEPTVYANAASYERALHDELATCEVSAYRVLSVVTAGAWVAMRYGWSCRPAGPPQTPPAERQAYVTGVWLMRITSGRLVESWQAAFVVDEALQLGQLGDLTRRLHAAGF